ncbi:hypothetical protein CLM62_20900 [Streptomyces sp. SA15]|nr:hypothetical protein CLM62_20900 [Streptomyces sp. SA15]
MSLRTARAPAAAAGPAQRVRGRCGRARSGGVRGHPQARKGFHRLWTSTAPPPAARPARTARARPRHAAVLAGALAGLWFTYGACLVVIPDAPLQEL